ncbi:hypothetical protein [Actinoalloteichus hoggarensis]|uniref:Uncharacterized protein n=1 Tax=Actinoalloteichus hoggarensis TaxID=1470176 RepID=A0A221W2R6_9PSEU|nr:hypothetical protein [Actinoalloteichus hoggarensis]ASO19901.1 hypothetical protein AHOG_11290 [Actinoalloteichus hoggarensis]
MVTSTAWPLVGIAAPVVSLVAALAAFVIVGRSLRRLDRQSREQAAYAMTRLNEQAEHRGRELRLAAQHGRRELEREADRRTAEQLRRGQTAQRRDAYAAFLAAANVYLLACYSGDPAEPDDTWRTELARLGQQLWASLAPVYLLGPPEVVDAADVYSRLLVLRLGRGRSVTAEELKTVRDVFVHVARTDLDRSADQVRG